MTPAGFGLSSHHCYSTLQPVASAVAVAYGGRPQIHVGPVPDMMLAELALSSRRCLSFAHLKSIHNCCSGSRSHGDLQGSS